MKLKREINFFIGVSKEYLIGLNSNNNSTEVKTLLHIIPTLLNLESYLILNKK